MTRRMTGVNSGIFLRLAEGDPPEGGTGGGGNAPAGGGAPEFTPITSQADLEKLLGDRLRRDRAARQPDYDDLKAKAAKFDQAEADKLSEVEKATTRATSAETRAEKAEREALTLRVAIDKALPAALVDRMKGSTREELEADADALLELVKPPGAGGSHRPAPDPHRHRDPAQRPAPGEGGKAEAARRFGGKTTN